MIIMIVGSRTINSDLEYDAFCNVIGASFPNSSKYTLLSGGAMGVDTFAERYANHNNIPIEVMKAQWDVYGKSAGFKRNAQMVEKADSALIFWDGVSKGTKHTIDLCKKRGIKFQVYGQTVQFNIRPPLNCEVN